MSIHTYYQATRAQKKYVGRLIKEARLARDLTPAEGAVQAGVSRQTFYRWEAGQIGSATTLILHWLLYDPAKSHDAIYWRERALMAEATLDVIERRLQQYREDHDA